jgi:hypothetical protein
VSLTEIEEDITRGMIIGLSALAFAGLPALAFADGNGAVTGTAGDAAAGAVVGGPVGAEEGGGWRALSLSLRVGWALC